MGSDSVVMVEDGAMEWWWAPWRKREWLRKEAAYKAARWDLWHGVIADPFDYKRLKAACDALRPPGWTHEIESRRWSTWNPRASRWTA